MIYTERIIVKATLKGVVNITRNIHGFIHTIVQNIGAVVMEVMLKKTESF